jgi:hypothetical protein
LPPLGPAFDAGDAALAFEEEINESQGPDSSSSASSSMGPFPKLAQKLALRQAPYSRPELESVQEEVEHAVQTLQDQYRQAIMPPLREVENPSHIPVLDLSVSTLKAPASESAASLPSGQHDDPRWRQEQG